MDCTKTLDYVRERNRMCDYYFSKHIQGCNYCPLGDIEDFHCTGHIFTDEKIVKVLQEWSDSHKETFPKITLREHNFLQVFDEVYDCELAAIGRNRDGALYFYNGISEAVKIDTTMFPFIEPGDRYPVATLLTYQII